MGNLGRVRDAEGLAQEWDVDSRLARDDAQLDDLGILGWRRGRGRSRLWCGGIAALAASVDRLALTSGAVQAAPSNGLIHAADGVADLVAAWVHGGNGESLGLLLVIVGGVGPVLLGLGAGNLAGRHLGKEGIDGVGMGSGRGGEGYGQGGSCR